MPLAPPPTPPQTQPPTASTAASTTGTESSNSMDVVKRHERFYETGESLLDPVILKVKHELAIDNVVGGENTNTYQAGNVLYRLSRHYLMSGSEFFYHAFSIPNEDTAEGKSDKHPVILPIESVGFDVYLWHDKV